MIAYSRYSVGWSAAPKTASEKIGKTRGERKYNNELQMITFGEIRMLLKTWNWEGGTGKRAPGTSVQR